MADLTSKENIKIEARAAEKRKFVETLIDISISSLNEMINSIHQLTSESEIDQLYESVVQFIQANKEEIENISLKNLLVNLQEKIASYAKLHEVNKIKILAKFIEFSVKLRRDFGAIVESSKGSLLLLLTFSSKRGYDLYKKDLKSGKIGKEILQLFLYPPLLNSFYLKAEDLVVHLNGRVLTHETGKKNSESMCQ